MRQHMHVPDVINLSADITLVTPSPAYTETLISAANGVNAIAVTVIAAVGAPHPPTKFWAQLFPGILGLADIPPSPPTTGATTLLPNTPTNVPTEATITQTNSQQTLVVWGNNNAAPGYIPLNITDNTNFTLVVFNSPQEGATVTVNSNGPVSVSITNTDSLASGFYAKIYPGTVWGESFPIAIDTGAVKMTASGETYTANVPAGPLPAAGSQARTLVVWPVDEMDDPFTLWFQHFLATSQQTTQSDWNDY